MCCIWRSPPSPGEYIKNLLLIQDQITLDARYTLSSLAGEKVFFIESNSMHIIWFSPLYEALLTSYRKRRSDLKGFTSTTCESCLIDYGNMVQFPRLTAKKSNSGLFSKYLTDTLRPRVGTRNSNNVYFPPREIKILNHRNPLHDWNYSHRG